MIFVLFFFCKIQILQKTAQIQIRKAKDCMKKNNLYIGIDNCAQIPPKTSFGDLWQTDNESTTNLNDENI